VASSKILSLTCFGVIGSSLKLNMALASPATWGLQKGQISDRSLSLSFAKTCSARNTYEAMEVPEILLVAWSDPIQTLVISRPGAKTSTHLPKFEK
jgi:hypothetical protein